MKIHFLRPLICVCLLAAWVVSTASLPAQPQFTGVQRLTNKEVALTLSAPVGKSYRLEFATSLSEWNGLFTFPTNVVTSLQYTDAATPYLPARFYRAAQWTGTNIVSGDHLNTTNGDVIFYPRYHASFVMSWSGKMIYNDPDSTTTYTGLAKADLLLVSHTHGDHFDSGTIDGVRKANTVLIAPQAVYNLMTAAQKLLCIVLTNGASTNVLGLNVLAVPAYNIPAGNHAQGVGNGYVLTIGDRRIYISGDTGDVPEIRALPNIDVAFLCMNPTFTMSVNQATNVIRSMRPKVVYPYHYNEGADLSNANTFKQRLGTDLGIEVRLRKWY